MLAAWFATPAQAATYPCSISPADIPTLHFVNAGNPDSADGTTYQAIGLVALTINATSGNCGNLVSPTAIRPLVGTTATATPNVAVPGATSAGGSLVRSSAGEVRYHPPSPGFSGTDTFTIDNNNTTRVINVTVIVDPGAASPPVVTSISPTSGPTAGGTVLTLGGSNLTGTTAVRFGSTPATSFTINSDTSITATAPAGSAATVDVTVTTAAGTSATSAADQYTYIGAPTVTAISPTSGGQSGGTSVTISGTRLTGAVAVTFGATSATGFTIISPTQITATSPAGTGTVDVRVTTAGGTSATSAGDQFAYQSPPTVAPKSASVAYLTATAIDLGSSITGAHSSIAVASGPAHGTTGVSGDTVTYTPSAGYSGADSFTYTATGLGGTSAPATVSITVTAPTFVFSPAAGALPGATHGSPYSQTIAASGAAAPYTYAPSAGAPPAGLTLSATGLLSGTPTATGSFNFTVTATDAHGATGSAAYSLVVAETTPVAGAVNATVAANSASNPITLNLSGDTATSVTVASAATHGTATAAGMSISYTPTAGYSGSDSFTYTATNASGTSVPATVTVTVTPPTLVLTPTTMPGATQNSPYSQTISASGGTAPYTFAVAAGALPPGLSLDASSGALSGTPSASGTFPFTITATDAHGATGARAYALAVAQQAPVAGPVSATVAANSSSNPIPLNLSGGTAISVALASAAAHGTAIASGASITYQPTPGYSGADSFTYTATNGAGTSTPATVSITVSAPTLVFAPGGGALTAATQNIAYSRTLSASDGTAPYSYALSAGALPVGLTLDAATGVLSGTPTASGTFSFSVTATDALGATGTAAYSLTVAVQAPVAGTVSTTVSANSSANPIPLNLSGGAASSVAVASAAGHGTASASGTSISYTPAAGYSGSDSFTYTATNASGTSAPATVSVTVSTPTLAFAPASGALPAATQNSAYSHTISVSGGTAPYSFTVSAGALPAGVTLSSAGVLGGTPTDSGSFTFTVTVTDALGAGGSANYSLAVNPQVPIAGAVSATVSANSSDNPVTLNLSGGTATSVAVASAPGHGTASASGTSIRYTPTAGYSGADSFTYTATNTSGTSTPATVSLTVSHPTLVFAPSAGTLPAATQNIAYSQTLGVSGGTAPYSYAITAGALPAGLTLDTATGVLSGTPTISGSFTFTVAATDALGATGAASYSLSVGAGLPVAGATSATVSANSSGNPIPLALSGGAANAVAVVTAPGHGTATASGTSISYTPTAGYSGADSFTYTATGPGGTSAPATVSLTISAPTLAFAPAAGTLPAATQNSAYSHTIAVSGGTAPYSFTVSAGALPAGVTLNSATGALAGTPTGTGSFAFTITVTDALGASGSAAYTLTVAIAAPVAGAVDASVPANSSANPINPSLSGGVAASVAVASQPSHGGVTVTGTTFQYTPATGFSGTDSFTYTATNASGTSPAATATITVVPAAPITHNPPATTVTVSSTTGGSGVVALSTLVTGSFDTLRVTSQPGHGTVMLSHDGSPGQAGGSTPVLVLTSAGGPIYAIYKPTLGYYGEDNFQFVASGAGGQSAPAVVAFTVVGVAPTAPSLTGSTTDNKMVSFDISSAATEGPFTDANIVAITPAGDATAVIVAGGTAGARTFRLDVTPKAHFGGTVAVTYRIANRFGFSAPGTVTVNVTARPDPSADPVVRALSDAQAETTRRFSQSQVDNFMRRTEALHNGGGKRFDMGVTMASNDPSNGFRDPSRPDRAQIATDQPDNTDPTSHAGSTGAQREPGQVAFWTGGAVDIGTRDATSRRSKLSATTSGLSGGADISVFNGLTVGIGGGYGRDDTEVADDAAHIGSSTKLIAAYGSAAPMPGLFIDAMAGHGWLDFDTRRAVTGTNAIARASRGGGYTIGSVSFGIDRTQGRLHWSAYGRGDYLHATLDAYQEHGADIYNLRFDARSVRSLTGTLGFRLGVEQPVSFGRIVASLRSEWQHEFNNGSTQGLDYADVVGPSFYSIRTEGWGREQFAISPGISLELQSSWKIDVEMGFQAAAGERQASSRVQVSKKF